MRDTEKLLKLPMFLLRYFSLPLLGGLLGAVLLDAGYVNVGAFFTGCSFVMAFFLFCAGGATGDVSKKKEAHGDKAEV